jgi:hypothetical protein
MGLEPSQQREAWQEAVETAPNGKLKAGRNGGQGKNKFDFSEDQNRKSEHILARRQSRKSTIT